MLRYVPVTRDTRDPPIPESSWDIKLGLRIVPDHLPHRRNLVTATHLVTGTLARCRNLFLAVELDYLSLVHVIS